jgi:two-component system, chemotaxis family, response regulator Rcp1
VSTPLVLVVDDNAAFLEVVEGVLGEESPAFTVRTVQTGTSALAYLERRAPFVDAPRPAFVVLDFHLPDMTAPVVLERLRIREELKNLPVLVLSQADWEGDERAAIGAGASAFRVKPSRTRDLHGLIVNFWTEECLCRPPS